MKFYMKVIHLIAFLLLASPFYTSVIAQELLLEDLYSELIIAQEEDSHNPTEFQQVLFTLLFEIEAATGLDHKNSVAIGKLNKEELEILYNLMQDKEKFFSSAYKALKRIELAREAPDEENFQVPDRATELLSPPSPTTPPYTPNYPPSYSAAYNIAKTLGLTSSREERCDGVGLEIYEDIYYGFEKTAAVADMVCNVMGCDPTGIVCAVVCGTVEVGKGVVGAVLLARVPLDACDKHSQGVDSAEIEAGYENSMGILKDLATTLGNQDEMLENQENMLENQENMLENQEEIIKLLKTPQGRRPGWNKISTP